jgi:hypothetical protein
MKQFRFILLCATIAVISSSLTGCKKGVYDEKAALAAQKDLLQFKYDQEIKLENLRQAGASALEVARQNLQYSFSIRTTQFNDSINRANNMFWNDSYYKRRDIAVKVLDLVTNAPVIGAEVTIPTSVGTVIKVKTDSTGVARFTPNVNIPNPASAMATMDGYAAGSVFGTIKGSNSEGAAVTISIWNLKNAPNTVKGKIYIENDLTNDAAEVAKKAFVNAFTLVTVNGYEQRFDFTATTDDNGDYSMKIPNLTAALQMAHAALEGTSKMYVNGYVPGSDTVPTVKSIAATYFLGTSTYLNNDKTTFSGINPSTNTYGTSVVEQPDGTNAGYSIPETFNRYHVSSAVLDSNGRGNYVKNLSFSASTLSSATADTAILNSSTIYTKSSLLSAANYSSNTTAPTTQYPNIFKAGTTVRDTVTATLYDLAANADGYWTAAPTLKFVLVTDSTTTVGKKFKYIEKLIQVKGGGTTKKADVNFSHQQYVYNLVKTYNTITASSFNSRNINAGFATVAANLINNGKTYVYDMSFGAGKLKTAVR